MKKPGDWFVVDTTDPAVAATASHTDFTIVWDAKGVYTVTLTPEPDGAEISADDWNVIDSVIIDSVARGYAKASR